jgi:uncharacterized protein (TIRG00374 family)
VRKLIFAIVLLLGTIFLLGRFSEFQKILMVLQSGNGWFIGLGILLAFLLLFNMAATYQQIYHVVGIEEKMRRLFFVCTAAYFVNIITPFSGGVPALAVYLADGRSRGHPTGRVMAAWAINLFFDYVGLLTVVVFGLAVLVRRNTLHVAEVTAFFILLLAAIALGTVIYLSMRSTVLLGRVLAWAARLVNLVARVFIHRDYLDESRAYSFAHDIGEGMSALRNRPHLLVGPLALALNNKLLLVIIFLVTFLSFDVPFSIGTLIGGVGVALLFVIVSPTPAGIGVVEGVLALTLRTLGVTLEAATVVTLGYRGLTFWLPFFVGMVTFRRVSKTSADDRVGNGNKDEPISVESGK